MPQYSRYQHRFQPKRRPPSTNPVDARSPREVSRPEAGFIDLITMLFVSMVVLALLIPFVLGTVRIVGLKQQLDQRAWNLLRSATLTGVAPPASLTIDGYSITTSLRGSLGGCSIAELSLATRATLPGLSILGKEISTYPVIGSATIATGAYRSPDTEGFNCAPTTEGI